MENRLEDWKMKNGYKAYPLCFVQLFHSHFSRDSLSFRVPRSAFLLPCSRLLVFVRQLKRKDMGSALGYFVRLFAYYCGKLTQYTTVCC